MAIGLVGRKCGMTRIFTDAGVSVPVTVIEVDPNRITQIKTLETDGYQAIQITTGERRESRVTNAQKGHFAKAGVAAGRLVQEFRVSEAELEGREVGGTIGVDLFTVGQIVDVTGQSKGKGFQGVVKRHGFGGVGQSTHGQDDRARKPGSIGACSYPAKVFKGMRMGGQMGGDRVTTQNLQVLKVIPEHNLLLVKGSVAGCNGSTVLINK